MPLKRDSSQAIFEYACHEGNLGLENILRAGKAEREQQTAPRRTLSAALRLSAENRWSRAHRDVIRLVTRLLLRSVAAFQW
jgi:hypothetical protein